MTGPPDATPVRERTRRVILDAAAGVLGRDPGASLSQVADAAAVGRTTLHRYFPDRADLLDAVALHAFAAIDAAVHRADMGSDTARAAMLRLCRELFDLGDLLTLVFGPVLSGRPEWTTAAAASTAVADCVTRGGVDATIDPTITVAWAADLLWSLLYAAHAHATMSGAHRHDALTAALHSLDGALRPH